METMRWEKRIEFSPAFDKRDPDPAKSYGIHGVELGFYLIGPKGAVQFKLYTNWHLPHVQKERDARMLSKELDYIDLRCFYHPLPADLGYHSPKPMYDGQEPIGANSFTWREPTEEEKAAGFLCKVPESNATGTFRPCELLGGRPCFYDGSSLNAERIYEVLLREGSDGVWRELEAYYEDVFKTQ